MKVLSINMKSATDINFSEAWELFISKGNDEAFSMIYFNHYDLLYYIGLKYSSDIQIIEDSIQNIFTYLLKNRNKLKKFEYKLFKLFLKVKIGLSRSDLILSLSGPN